MVQSKVGCPGGFSTDFSRQMKCGVWWHLETVTESCEIMGL